MTEKSFEQISKDINHAGKRKIKIAVSDIDGILRGKYIHKDKFLSSVKKGFGFCSVIFGWDCADTLYNNSTFTGWHNGYPDTLAKIDLETFRKVPWDRDIPFFLGDFYENDGITPLSICPRQNLKKIVSRAHSSGFYPQVGCEYEWFNFIETPQSLADKGFKDPTPLTPGMFGYSLTRASQSNEFFNDLMDLMEKFHIPIEGLHTETGPGVYEAAIQHTHPLEAADRGVLFKTATKEIAQKYGITASFMARWHTDLPGCSGHIHQSLADKDGSNLFAEGTDSKNLNPLLQSFLAGQLKYLPELLPMLAPTINSYKRLVEGFWAPTRATWGFDNRTCSFRVIPGGQASRVEIRLGGSDMNAYLGIAASLGAGLLGIEQNLTLEDAPVTGSAYERKESQAFATNLYDATSIMEKSKVARELFGDAFVEHFTKTRYWEWQQAQSAITDWELKRYFENI